MRIRGVWRLGLAWFVAGCSQSLPPPAQISGRPEPPPAISLADARAVMSQRPPANAMTTLGTRGLLPFAQEATAFERQRTLTLYFQACDAARAALLDNRVDDARRQIQYAIDLMDQNPAPFSGLEVPALHDAAAALQDAIDHWRDKYICYERDSRP